MSGVLFLAHRVPFPPDRGDKIRSHHVLKALAELGPVHVGCFAETAADRAAESDVAGLAATWCMPNRSKPLPVAGLEAMMRGEPPVGAMMDGAMTVMAGILLIMPGLITDTIGFLLLIPPVRHFLAGRLAAGMFGAGDIDVEVYENERGHERRTAHRGPGVENGGPVIEGDFERLDERTVDPRKGRPNEKS